MPTLASVCSIACVRRCCTGWGWAIYWHRAWWADEVRQAFCAPAGYAVVLTARVLTRVVLVGWRRGGSTTPAFPLQRCGERRLRALAFGHAGLPLDAPGALQRAAPELVRVSSTLTRTSPLLTVSFRILWPVALIGLMTSCNGSHTADPPRPESEHFTLAELQQLGCTVKATPKRSQSSIPLVGTVDGYGMTSATPCATQLVSLLQPINYEDAVWEGARSAAKNFAKEHGYTQERFEGEIGEYSEIEVFSRNGKQVGFEYSVQARGTLHSVIVLSDSLEPDAAFEAVLKTKL